MDNLETKKAGSRLRLAQAVRINRILQFSGELIYVAAGVALVVAAVALLSNAAVDFFRSLGHDLLVATLIAWLLTSDKIHPDLTQQHQQSTPN